MEDLSSVAAKPHFLYPRFLFRINENLWQGLSPLLLSCRYRLTVLLSPIVCSRSYRSVRLRQNTCVLSLRISFYKEFKCSFVLYYILSLIVNIFLVFIAQLPVPW